jgi:serine/threonine protein kinase
MSVDTFLKAVVRSGLVDVTQLKLTLKEVPADQRGSAPILADFLVKRGKLSRFQATKLLKGTAMGLVLGSFEVVSSIGKGGMGAVYLARDRRDGKLVALKILPPKRAREEERMLARFQREMELCQRVDHPHIAKTQEVGKIKGIHYIAMEFIPGKSLYRLVSEGGPLPVKRAAHLFGEVAAALQHAHGQGLIHRDMKPSNILVTPNDHAKVLDLGLALIEGESAAPREVIGGQGYVVGSMDYIAPEQTEDATRVDARADLYALGCTLYFALSGRPPFPRASTREKIRGHRKEEPPLLEMMNPAVPSAFAGVVRKLMAKKPADRYPSAAALREALVPWGSGEAERPLDREGDANYQKALAELKSRTDNTVDLLDVLAAPPPRTIRFLPRFLARPLERLNQAAGEYLWVGLGVIGFWVVVLGLLGLVLLLQ